jgi:hypothetical protein
MDAETTFNPWHLNILRSRIRPDCGIKVKMKLNDILYTFGVKRIQFEINLTVDVKR